MEVQNVQPGYVIEISRDVRVSEGSSRGTGSTTKICSGASCGFSDAGTLSKDAKERAAAMKKLWISIALCYDHTTDLVMEDNNGLKVGAGKIVGGLKANSLAISTDAAHLLSDVAAFGISLFSLWASSWEANPRYSYGFFRIEILGTLISIQMIWLLAGILVYEAIVRMINDTGEVQGFLMFLVSAFGFVVNIVMAVLLGHDHGQVGGHGHYHGEHGQGHNHSHEVHDPHAHSHGDDHEHHSDHSEPLLKSSDKEKKKRNNNIQGAYLHVLGDSIQSIGVMIGGEIIWYKPEWKKLDLICTLIFSVLVLATTIRMLRNIMEVLMESMRREIDATKLEKDLCEMDEVIALHELHIWAITVGKVLLSCHAKVKPGADADLLLDKVVDHIKRVYNISHVTIQIER
ncbi:hypothetical protein MKW98_011577 [Papaver atlanticum]|uniref:Uncharacterized protein n=1 Tax=Papaver atlanticum TaxID=357466 RepID=A0AAD4S874_9MAGN|nr:hypothetical protein MKW98_011577 [Papaver atlanticum]